ncbi:MAG: hypothetical protein Q9169_003614 [Polycauliona sp. 2 TL-2023]
MPSQPTIPPLLSNDLQPPSSKNSLILVTSVLGASANWVILRQIYTALKLSSGLRGQATAVILTSWLRGLQAWKDGAKRLGLNLSQTEGVTFIDALQSGVGPQGRGIGEVEELLLEAINKAKLASTRILLVLDGIDFLLAGTEMTTDDLLDAILELREHVDLTIVSASADYPLVQAHRSPLELDHTALTISLAHEANAVWGVRELDTGSAKDVSGVLRITRGPAVEVIEDSGGEDVEEKELLYCIMGDGGVRRRVLRPLASAITNHTHCADAAVAVPSIFKSTPAHHADTLRLKFVNVGRSQSKNPLPPISEIVYTMYPEATRTKLQTNTVRDYRQLGHESQEEKDHWYRPYALDEGGTEKIQEWLPDRSAQRIERAKYECIIDKRMDVRRGLAVIRTDEETYDSMSLADAVKLVDRGVFNLIGSEWPSANSRPL